MAFEDFELYEFINSDMVDEDLPEKQSKDSETGRIPDSQNPRAPMRTIYNFVRVNSSSSSHTQPCTPLLRWPTTPVDNSTAILGYPASFRSAQGPSIHHDTSYAHAVSVRGQQQKTRGEDSAFASGATHGAEQGGSIQAGSLDVDTHGPASHPCATHVTTIQVAHSARDQAKKENQPPVFIERGVQMSPAQTRASTSRKCKAPEEEEQPVAGPSSVTLDDLAAEEEGKCSTGGKGDSNVRRGRTKKAQVAAAQRAAQRAPHHGGTCGLDGGCSWSLTNDLATNKKHVRDEHDCALPRNAGVEPFEVDTYRSRKQILTAEMVRECAAEGALACTWGPSDGARCGEVFRGKTRQQNLERHMETVHWKRELKCDLCKDIFGCVWSLNRHKKLIHHVVVNVGDEEEESPKVEEDEPPKKKLRTQ